MTPTTILIIIFRKLLSIMLSKMTIIIPITMVAIVDCKKFVTFSKLHIFFNINTKGIINAKNSAIVVPIAAPTAPYLGINNKLNKILETAAQIKEIIETFSLLMAGSIWHAIKLENEIKKTIEQRILIGTILAEKLAPQKIIINDGVNKKIPVIIG